MAWTSNQGSKQGWPQRELMFVFCTAACAIYAWFVVTAYRAYRLSERSDQSSIAKAVALAPGNATYHDLLCRSMIFASQKPGQAMDACKKASELNPYDSSIWLDLAQAYYSAGDKQSTDVAIHKALAVDPTTPDTIWNVANFFLAEGNTSEALKQFAIVLREDPSLAEPTLNICWQSLHDMGDIQGMLPPNPAVYLAFIKLLLSAGEAEAAHQVWSALIGLNSGMDYHQALFYIDSQIQAHNVSQAWEAWQQLSSRSKDLQAYLRQGNLIMNGSFSQEILNSGFGWRYASRPDITVTLDQAEVHSGDRAVRLAYQGSNGDSGISQYIAAQPNRRYRLSAWVKSEDLETANGPMLAILDGYSNDIYGSTEETTGTTAWHRIETVLQTGPDAKLLMFAVLRHPGETSIQGKFWIDDIRLEPF